MTLNDKLADNVSLVSATTTAGTCAPTVTCALGDLAPGGSAVVTVTAKATGEGVAINAARVTSAVADPNLSDNAGSVTTKVDPTAGPPLQDPPSGGPPPPAAFAGVTLGTLRVKVGRTGRTRVTVSCPASAQGSCTGTLALLSAGKVRATPGAKRAILSLGRASFVIAAGKRAVLKLRLSAKGRRLLTRTRAVKARQVAVARDGRATPATTSARLAIKAKA